MSTCSPSSASKTLVGGANQPPPATWTDSDELGLLRAVLEIALEPAEAFDPRISLFARIERNLGGKSFTRSNVLSKVKELRKRYEDGGALNAEALDVSHRIWGIEKEEEEEEEKNTKKRKRKLKRKKRKKVCIYKLLNVADKEIENELHPQKHFLAIMSSSWGKKYSLQCCQSGSSSQNGSCSSSLSNDFFTSRSGKLTENVDSIALKHCSNLVLTALNDVSQKHCNQHEEELIDKPNKYQELISMSNLNVAQPHVHDPAIILSNGPETPARTDEANGRKFRSESSSLVAEPRVSLPLEACTEGRPRASGPSSFSLCSESVDKYVSNPVRHEYPRIERTAGPHQKLEY